MKCTSQWMFTCVTVTSPSKIRTSEHGLPSLRDHLSLPSQCHSTPPQLKTLLTPTAIEAFVYWPSSPVCSPMNFRQCAEPQKPDSVQTSCDCWKSCGFIMKRGVERGRGCGGKCEERPWWSWRGKQVGGMPVGCEGDPAADPGMCILIPSHSSSEVQREGLEIQCLGSLPGKWRC